MRHLNRGDPLHIEQMGLAILLLFKVLINNFV